MPLHIQPDGTSHISAKIRPRFGMSGVEIPEGRGATVRITFADARRGSRELDVTDVEAEKLGGVVARRGRRPKNPA
jgi:hypothetical protein